MSLYYLSQLGRYPHFYLTSTIRTNIALIHIKSLTLDVQVNLIMHDLLPYVNLWLLL